MTAEAGEAGARERRVGELRLAGATWEWQAVPWEPGDEDRSPNPFLRWFEITFRRADDPEQEARGRVGIAPGDWSAETLREVLRSVRARTWRDDDGRLWSVRLEGWTDRGISTGVEESAEDRGPEIVFVSEAGGEEVRRDGGEVDSLTDPGPGGLHAVLEGDG